MKKTIKTAVAMLLAIIIACGSMVAFAATPADIQCNLTEEDEAITYAYAGTLTVGGDSERIRAKEDSKYVYFTFEAEEEGYYKVSSSSCSFDDGWFTIPETYENGVYLGSKKALAGNDFTDRYFYLEKGEHIVCVNFYWLNDDVFKVEYVGELVDVKFDDEDCKKLVLGSDIWEEHDENGELCYYFCSSVEFEFSSGDKFVIDYADVRVYSDKELEHGENEVEIGLYGLDFRVKKTISVIDVTKIISKVEMTNVEDHIALKYYYNGGVDYPYVENETLTVTYTDGTTEVIENFSGYEYLEKYDIPVRSDFSRDDDWDMEFYVAVANEKFIREKCYYTFASDIENLDRYNEINYDDIEYRFYWIGLYFRNIFTADSASESLEYLRYFLWECTNGWLYTFAYIMRNTASLFGYIN